MNEFATFLDSGRWLKLLFMICGMILIVMLVKVQYGKDRVNFKHYLVDDDGKTSPTRGFTLGCFLATTWGFVVLVDKGTITEWYFNGYILLWCANRQVTKWMDFQRELRLRTNDGVKNEHT